MAHHRADQSGVGGGEGRRTGTGAEFGSIMSPSSTCTHLQAVMRSGAAGAHIKLCDAGAAGGVLFYQPLAECHAFAAWDAHTVPSACPGTTLTRLAGTCVRRRST